MRNYIIHGSGFICLVSAPSFDHAMHGFHKMQPDKKVLMVVEITCDLKEIFNPAEHKQESDPIDDFLHKFKFNN